MATLQYRNIVRKDGMRWLRLGMPLIDVEDMPMVIAPSMLDAFVACCVGRRDAYALQRPDGGYQLVREPLSYPLIFQHLQGVLTLGTYVIDEGGLCRFVVFDSDSLDGLSDLFTLHHSLAGQGIMSYLEHSRRGAHLWVFFAAPVDPALARAWLLPCCPAGVEFYPKQDRLTRDRPYGSLVRLPLGVHLRSGERYPFLDASDGGLTYAFTSVTEALPWFSTVQKVIPLPTITLDQRDAPASQRQKEIAFKNPSSYDHLARNSDIREWCRQQNPFEVIGRYVELDHNGLGHCPFGAHHSDGLDQHPSFHVYQPTYPDVMCWYCHTLQGGGSLFDFFKLYYSLDSRDLWSRILAGAQF
jgi:hypothetical protein